MRSIELCAFAWGGQVDSTTISANLNCAQSKLPPITSPVPIAGSGSAAPVICAQFSIAHGAKAEFTQPSFVFCEGGCDINAHGWREMHLSEISFESCGSVDQSVDQWWKVLPRRSRGQTRTTRGDSDPPQGQLARPVLLPVMLGHPWLPTDVSTRAPVIHPVRVHK
jgi:hypothetical protein